MKKLVSILMAVIIMVGTIGAFATTAGAVKNPRIGEMYMYARIDGIDGDAAAPFNNDYLRWIDVINYEQSFESVDGKEYTKLTFTHYLDCASPAIQEYCKNSTVIDSADFHITVRDTYENEENAIYTLHLENAVITSVKSTGAAMYDDGWFTYPTETVTLLAEISTSAV